MTSMAQGAAGPGAAEGGAAPAPTRAGLGADGSSWTGDLPGWPTFIREFSGTLAARSQFVLYGNVKDVFLIPPPGSGSIQPPHDWREGSAWPTALPLTQLVWQALRPSGYRCLITYDPVHGIGCYPPGQTSVAEAARLLGRGAVGSAPALTHLRRYLAAVAGVAPPTLRERIASQLGQGNRAESAQRQEDEPGLALDGAADLGGADGWIARTDRPRAGFLVDYAARITRSPGNLDADERDFFLFCLKLAHVAERCSGGPPGRPFSLFNPIIWLAEGERDLPAWLTSSGDHIRTIGVPLPDLEARSAMAARLARNFGVTEPTVDERKTVGAFAAQTHGLTLRAMEEIARLAAERRLPFGAISDAIRVYKLGIADNPWRRASVRHRIVAGELQITANDPDAESDGVAISARVFGQDHAVRKTMDILKRAALGLSGAQASNPGHRPRGVIFFAGPTGVGKTELAKATAELLFGQPDSFLRFDMSEFAAEHSDHRLVGAPPGYVGFEAGGELTSAVRAQPFRVVLFDEIEKAHRRVLDKFLQILEDGRLTDGQGVTTYFSECVLIFTSNLGIMIPESPGSPNRVAVVQRGEPYTMIEAKVRRAIAEHFTSEIGRPELLNRFGDNIVVFNFIADEAAGQIFDFQVANITRRLKNEQQLTLVLTSGARAQLREICTANLDNGGRGIGNMLESALVNPLARALFDQEQPAGSSVVVSDASLSGGAYSLTLGPGGEASA